MTGVTESHRIDQTITADDPKRIGNCLSACVATYLGRQLDQVPHFIEVGAQIVELDPTDLDTPTTAWWAMFLGYMAGHGLWAYEVELENVEPDQVAFVMGMSERGVCHQVLYRGRELWHDPHPSRAGIVDVREVLVFRPVRHDHQPTQEAERP